MWWRCVVLLLGLVLVGSPPPWAAAPKAPVPAAGFDDRDLAAARYVEGEVLVRWRGACCQALEAIAADLRDAWMEGEIGHLTVPPGRELEVAHALAASPEVAWAQPNYLRQVLETANDPRFAEQWSLQRMQVPAAWDITTGDASVIVAVIDTGVDLGHPDLKERLVEGFNFLEPEALPQDDLGHGTHAAGTIAATMNNHIGIAGVAPGVSIMPLKAFDRRGVGKDSAVAAAIHHAIDHGAWVINMSFGGNGRSPLLEEAIARATNSGTALIVAAGNDGRAAPSYPAASGGSIAVAATTVDDGRSSYSNFGHWVDVAAPGQAILSTYWDASRGSTYRTSSGTSMAAPHVAGVVALMFSIQPGLTIPEIETVLKSTADPVNGGGLGAGRVNAARAVGAAATRCCPLRDLDLTAPSPTAPAPTASPTGAPAEPTPPPPATPPVTGGSGGAGPTLTPTARPSSTPTPGRATRTAR